MCSSAPFEIAIETQSRCMSTQRDSHHNGAAGMAVPGRAGVVPAVCAAATASWRGCRRGAIHEPGVCQHARKLAAHVRQHLQRRLAQEPAVFRQRRFRHLAIGD